MSSEYQCAFCRRPATHLCRGCGKWLCDSARCRARGAAASISADPLGAIRAAPAAAAHEVLRLGSSVADALGFKP